MSWNGFVGLFRDLKDVAIVVGIVSVPALGLGKWAIAQEVKKQQRPVVEYIERAEEQRRDQILIAEWSACMQYATGYAEGADRKRRCDLEREQRRKVWQFEDCEREYGIGSSECAAKKPRPIAERRE